MNWKQWLLPWRAKAKIEELEACLSGKTDAAPFTAKIKMLEERLEQTLKSLKASLDEKHVCATLLSSTRASEQDWRDTANKIDLEKNELASLNRTLVDQLEHAKADVEEWKGRVKVERKEREDVEKAIGGMKAEVMEAQTLAAKSSKLQEALDHEIAEHRLAKEQVAGLTKWIRVAHRLDSPSPKGTIRRILQSARFRSTSRSGTVTALALLCFAWTAMAQAPFWRNSWSTNQAPPVIGTNLWVSNTASGDGWFFYNQPNSNVVARLRDITAATASGTNFNGIVVTNDIGQPARRVRSYYGSNIYSVNAVISNGLTLPFASDFPTAALASNRWLMVNSNSTLFLVTSYDGTNMRTWTFKTNGQTVFPSTITGGGSVYASLNVLAGPNGQFSWDTTGTPVVSRIGNGVSLLPGIGLSTNAFQVCDTNGEPTFLVASNANIRIKTEQMTNSLSGFQPLGCYGAMMMPLTNILAIGPTAYTNINGYSVLNTNWFRCNTNTGTISNVFAGYYRMTISASVLAANNDALEGCLLTNGVDSECISFYKIYDAAARWDSFSASGLLYLPTNCQCSFGLKKTTAGNVAIRRAAIVIGTP